MAKPAPMGIGHNGFTFETRRDLPPDLPKLYFARFTLQDLLDDLLRMPKEERGVYVTALLVMYKEMESLPADDKMASMMLGLDVREWRHIKAKLLARGVLYERATGRISNKRFESEICAYVTEYNNRREAAVEREQRKRSKGKIAETSPGDRRDIAGRSAGSRGDVAEMSPTSNRPLGGDNSEKRNEINETVGTSGPREKHEADLRARDLIITNYESLSNTTYLPPNSAAAGSGLSDGDGSPSEFSLSPHQSKAMRLLAPYFGSSTDPNMDVAYAVVMDLGSVYSFEDVCEAAMDFDDARRNREYRAGYGPLTEPMFRQWVRTAVSQRRARETAATKAAMRNEVTEVEKPPRLAKRIPPGEFAEGFVMGENGRVALVNGKYAEWLERFNQDVSLLENALIEVSGNLKLNGPIPPPAQIESWLARKAGDVRQRHKNALAATQARIDADKPAEGVVIESKSERLRRIAEGAMKQQGGSA